MKATMDKVALISLTHVIEPSMEPNSTWIVHNQHDVYVLYKVMHPFIEYASCNVNGPCPRIFANTKL